MYNQNNRFGDYKTPEPADNFVTYGQRPLSITVVCVVITLALVLNMISLIALTSDPSLSVPVWYWLLTAGQFALVVASIIGLWNMWKWGAYTYTVNFVINVVILIISFNIVSLILPIVLLVFIYRKFNEMR